MAKIPKHPRIGQRVRLPKTLAAFDKLPRRSQATFQNVTHVLTRMREGASLKSAAAEYRVDPRSVVRIGKSGLRKTASGRYGAKPCDPLLRVLSVPVHGGRIEVGVAGSRKASAVSDRSNAQRRFVNTGDDSQLRALEDKTILDASGREVPFLTDEGELARQGDLGALSFESIYARRG
ncbi:MAG: hypothetical protein WAK19_02180 [Candidatus Cybelea sp.]